MAVSRALRRLLRIRDLEEEQNRLALESALGELRGLEHALAATAGRDHRGRELVKDSAFSGLLPDRVAGLEETRAAGRHAAAIGPRIETVKGQVTTLRQAFLLKRVERRQAETLIGETEAREAIAADRRGQQSLDDWYRSRLYREAAAADDSGPVAPGPVSQGLARTQASRSEIECASEKLERESTRSGSRVPESE
jgi:flagellar biosynthesis chaperone FliJ